MKALRKVENAFKQKTDVFHFAVGFFSCMVNIVGFVGFITSILTTVAFIIYQTGEEEPRIESYINLVEFILGFVFALPFIILYYGG